MGPVIQAILSVEASQRVLAGGRGTDPSRLPPRDIGHAGMTRGQEASNPRDEGVSGWFGARICISQWSKVLSISSSLWLPLQGQVLSSLENQARVL